MTAQTPHARWTSSVRPSVRPRSRDLRGSVMAGWGAAMSPRAGRVSRPGCPTMIQRSITQASRDPLGTKAVAAPDGRRAAGFGHTQPDERRPSEIPVRTQRQGGPSAR
jgi:hypothetical protein